MSKYDHLYKNPKRYFAINNGDGSEVDTDLHPIVFKLPDPPSDLTLIKNYGKHPDEQIYFRDPIPLGLTNLEREAVEILQDKSQNHKNEYISGFKISEMFWQLLFDNAENYKKEIEFIKHTHWKRVYGEWCYIDGEPIWIPPWLYSYLNFWVLDGVKDNDGYPELRFRDWKAFCFFHYLYTTSETFKDRDKNGIALKNENGEYEIIDIGIRVFYGPIQPKNRRSGATQQAICCEHEIITHNSGAHATMLSKSVSDVEDHFNKKLLTAWQKQPIFIKPVWDGNNDPGGKIEYKYPANIFTNTGLRSSFGFIRSTAEGVVDSLRLSAILNDEQGKETGGGRVDVSSRWRITKQTLSTGNGARIHGFAFNPSTAEEMEDGAKNYYRMCVDSDFYTRDEMGQTQTGLALVYFPAQYCLEGFVDIFGKPVLNAPTERQIRLSKNDQRAVFTKLGIGSRQALLGRRQQLLADGTPESIRIYREEVRKHPMRFAESWLGNTGDIGFPIELIDRRLAEGRTNNNEEKWIVRGNFVWSNGIDSEVSFKQMDNGKFELSYRPQAEFTNKKKKVHIFNGNLQKYELQFAPVNPRFIVGADPFAFENKQKAKGRESKSSKSDGGIAAYWPFDSSVDQEDKPELWQSDRFILSYRHRPPSLEEYNEDVLMASVYLGAMCYPENNQRGTWEHFIRRGYGGYLKHDIDPVTGVKKNEPGYWAGDSSKKEMFNELNDYFARSCHRERHMSFLRESKDIRTPDELNHFDRLAAHGAAIYGARDMQVSYKKNTGKNLNIEDIYSKWLNV